MLHVTVRPPETLESKDTPSDFSLLVRAVTSLLLSPLTTVSLSLYRFSMHSRTLSAVYYWSVISSFRVSTACFQAHLVKHKPDQRASLRQRVSLQPETPVAARGGLAVWFAKCKSTWSCPTAGFCPKIKAYRVPAARWRWEKASNKTSVKLISWDFHQQRQWLTRRILLITLLQF